MPGAWTLLEHFCQYNHAQWSLNKHKIRIPTRNSITLGFQRYKQSRDLRVIYYIMVLLMLTIRNLNVYLQDFLKMSFKLVRV